LLLSYASPNTVWGRGKNLVYTELIKAGYEVYFYNKNFECDFIAKKEDKIIAMQVCYELNNRNQKREFNALFKLPFNVDEKILLTYNQTENRSDEIRVVTFWEYFIKRF